MMEMEITKESLERIILLKTQLRNELELRHPPNIPMVPHGTI